MSVANGQFSRSRLVITFRNSSFGPLQPNKAYLLSLVQLATRDAKLMDIRSTLDAVLARFGTVLYLAHVWHLNMAHM